MSAPRLDLQASTFTVRTRAEGMLSRLAHDLEIAAEGFSGDVRLDGDRWSSTVRFPTSKMRVVGVLRGDTLDRGKLSDRDRADIETRLRGEVLSTDVVVVEAEGESRNGGRATIRVGAGESTVDLRMSTETRREGELVAEGGGTVSLRALGIGEVKGPLGAFKVKDTVELSFFVMLLPG